MILNLLLNAGICAGFLLHSFLLGHALLHNTQAFQLEQGDKNNSYLHAFFALSIGTSISILALIVLGTLGLLNVFFVGLVGSMLISIAVLSLKSKAVELTHKLSAEMIYPVLLFALTISFSWHAPGHADDTSFHLPLARFYLENEAIKLHEYLRFPLFPQNMNMLIVLGLMLGDAITAQIFATLPWFIIGIGLMGVCKWLVGSSTLGVFIAVVLAKVIGAFKVGFSYAYVDAGLAMFCWAALMALVFWRDCYSAKGSNSAVWILIAGFLAGAAAGTKLFGGVFAFILLVYILAITRNIRAATLFSTIVLLSGVWWYLRSYFIAGDPFHPLGAKYFGYFLWNEADLLSQISEQGTHGSEKNLIHIFSALKDAGIQFWILAFIGIFYRGMPKSIQLMQFVFVTYFLFWFFVSQVERYLAPISVLATFLSFYTLYSSIKFFDKKIGLIQIRNKYTLACHVFLILLCAIISFKELRSGITKSEARLQKYPGYELLSRANELIPDHGDKVVQIGFEGAAYFFKGTTIGDWFGIARYSQMMDCRSGHCLPLEAGEMANLLTRFNSKILIISFNRFPLFNPDDYSQQFNLIFRNSQGVLMTVKNNYTLTSTPSL